mmetsp:Transcript_25143/g.75532  ORF Transcript_25143/g.75532 Transcript_25143/m.75532 type:complete len:221 (+) Transcript_25143:765-1427(+)
MEPVDRTELLTLQQSAQQASDTKSRGAFSTCHCSHVMNQGCPASTSPMRTPFRFLLATDTYLSSNVLNPTWSPSFTMPGPLLRTMVNVSRLPATGTDAKTLPFNAEIRLPLAARKWTWSPEEIGPCPQRNGSMTNFCHLSSPPRYACSEPSETPVLSAIFSPKRPRRKTESPDINVSFVSTGLGGFTSCSTQMGPLKPAGVWNICDVSLALQHWTERRSC